jgi:hypothetical protein
MCLSSIPCVLHASPLYKVKVKLSLCFSYLSTPPWRRIGKWKYNSTHSWPRH